MEIKGIAINCPYWMNKIRYGEIVRGYGNGKADAKAIKEKLEETFDSSDLYKLAKRVRTGIDCSGFVYRVLNFLVPQLNKIFPGGINKTNAARLTNIKDAVLITQVDNIKPGDMIRMRSGKHVAVIIEKNEKKIIYAHSTSSRYTANQGVHLGEIEIVDSRSSLEKQIWKEKLREKGSFKLLYFRPEKGDGVYRLKWMNS